MIVESSISIRNVKPVMPAVDGCVQPFVHVHGAVDKVLPGIDDADCENKLKNRNDGEVDSLGSEQLPFREGRCSHGLSRY